MNSDVDVVGEEGHGNSLSIESLPRNVLSAIINKINEKSQKSTQIFNEDYIATINDIKSLIIKINQEFDGTTLVNRGVTIRIHLSSNQKFDFNSWEEFEEFDSSQSENTKSISIEYDHSITRLDGNLESYKVQISLQNIKSNRGFYFGPMAVMRIEDAGIPPVSIHTSVKYSNYIRGKNIINTIESWVKGLKIEVNRYDKFFNKYSSKISNFLKSIVVLSSIIGCSHFISNNDGSVEWLAYFICFASAFVFVSYKLGNFFANSLEMHLDTHYKCNIISLTKGDEAADGKNRRRNEKNIFKSIAYAFSLSIQISCSVYANYIWTKLF